ncbi:hypothetical protein [Halobacterium jilantaiense]|uniref:Uncharacterized protein n=1 Tax=Halobacterium jilantaiense TaxID=355548 RepID=A0A1I0NDF3_9EURY|nr:hypothetical protein [Halobacterium jilantaiense]SEV98717.1 hypothetical protein SAMN04487945_0754 [Halobacterium jilantaiense]
MNYRVLVSPALYGGSAAAVVAAVGYSLAIWQSVTVYMPTTIFVAGGLSAFGLLAGSSSMNESSEDIEVSTGGDITSAPTEAGTPRRLLLLCFSVGLVVAGILGVTLLG